MKTIISAFVLALGIAASGFFIGDALGRFKQFDRYVSVKGLSEQVVKSDKAIWQMHYNFAADNLTDLYKGIADSQNKIKDFLVKQGFSEQNISILSISVTDQQSVGYSSNPNAKRYNASGGLTVTSSEVDKVRESVQKTNILVQAGVVLNQSDVRYTFISLNQVKPPMLDEATANAKKAAETFAKNANSHLGSIRSASQGLFTIEEVDESGLMKTVRIVTTIQYFLS